jgi:hypothetical protein
MQANFTLQKIMHGDAGQLDQLFQAAAAPSAASVLRNHTAEKACKFLLKPEQFDAALTPHIDQLQKALTLHIAQDDKFYSHPENTLRQLINLLISRGSSWYPRESKASQQFLEKLIALISKIEQGSRDHINTASKDFQDWLATEDKRSAMLESRLCETEINSFKTLSAECKVLDFINAALAQKPFPVELQNGVTVTLKSELLHSYFTAGHDNPFWKTWQRLLPSLGKVFSTIAASEMSADDSQVLYRTIPALLNELERSTTIPISNPESYRQWVELLSEQLMLTIKKQPIHCSIFLGLRYPDGFSNLNTRVTADLLQQSNDIKEGEWILFKNENKQIIRCKLALKSAETNQMLFVDNTGRKVMNKSMQDFAVCIATGIAKKMTLTNTEDIIAKTIQALIDLQGQKKTQTPEHKKIGTAKPQADITIAQTQAEKHLQAQLQTELKLKAEHVEEEKHRVVQALSARRAAAQKALTEAAAIAEERAQRTTELALKQERERLQLEAEQAAENLQRIQLANINISALNLGARVELIHNGEPVRCKLAVIIAATGKYIFSDNIGRKIAEFQREQLVQALLNKQLTLVNNGDSFDDQLAKVIRGLRKDIS